MVKVVIGTDIGGFILSEKARSYLEETGNFDEMSEFGYYTDPRTGMYEEIPRHHPDLVRCVETLGKDAGKGLEVKTLEGKQYIIRSNDAGQECVYTPLSILEQDWITSEYGEEDYGGSN
jgi:hypothetical protein